MSPRLACFQLTALSKTTLFQLVYLLKFFIVIFSHFWMQWPNFTYCFLLLFQISVSTVSANVVWFVICRKRIVVNVLYLSLFPDFVFAIYRYIQRAFAVDHYHNILHLHRPHPHLDSKCETKQVRLWAWNFFCLN